MQKLYPLEIGADNVNEGKEIVVAVPNGEGAADQHEVEAVPNGKGAADQQVVAVPNGEGAADQQQVVAVPNGEGAADQQQVVAVPNGEGADDQQQVVAVPNGEGAADQQVVAVPNGEGAADQVEAVSSKEMVNLSGENGAAEQRISDRVSDIKYERYDKRYKKRRVAAVDSDLRRRLMEQ